MSNKRQDAKIRAEFGEVIHRLRRQKKLTQEELSELTGITDVYLRSLENGDYTATWIIWLRICTVLEIDIAEIQRKYILPELKEVSAGRVDIYRSDDVKM